MSETQVNNLKGILFNLLSMFLFVIMDVFIKILVADLPVYEVIFFRCLTGIPVFLLIVHYTSGLSTLRIVNVKFQFFRAVLGVFGMFFFFNSYKYLSMADAASILFSAPLILTVLSVIFLKEKVGLHRSTAILLGFTGVLFIARPGAEGMDMYMILPLIGAISWALVIMIMRVLSKTDHANAVTLVFSLMGAFVTSFIIAYHGGFVGGISTEQYLMLIASGVIGIFAQLFMTISVKWAEASVFGSTKYISLVFSVMSGFIVFGEMPTHYTFIGIFLIIASGLYNVYREYVLNKARKIKVVRY